MSWLEDLSRVLTQARLQTPEVPQSSSSLDMGTRELNWECGS